MIPVLALAAAAALAAPQAHAAAQPSPAHVPLIPWRNRWAIEAQIGGKTRRFLLDTASGLTMISPGTAKAAGCTPWGRLTGFQMMGARGDGPRCEGLSLKIGGLVLTPPTLGIIDLAEANPNDAGLDGVVGLNAFEGRTVSIDFAAGDLTVETPASAARRTATMRSLPVRLSREVGGLALAVLARVPTAKGPLWMELDSGNGGTVLVSKVNAELVGLDPAVEGRQHADFAVVGPIHATGDAFTPDMIIDGNLGMPFLRNWAFTFDLERGRAWIGKPAHPPAAPAPLPAAPEAGGQKPAG